MFFKTKMILPVLAAGLLVFQACDKKGGSEFRKTENGLEYKLFAKDKDGKYEAIDARNTKDTTQQVQDGMVITMEQEIRLENDSVLFSTFTDTSAFKRPAQALVEAPKFKGDLAEAFKIMAVGDSGVFRVSADSLFEKSIQQPMPPYIKPGSYLTFILKVTNIQTQQEAMNEQQQMFEQQQQEMLARAEKQKVVDDEKIQQYVKEQGLNAQKTASGIYYVITKKGTGPNARAGQTVSVLYKGTLLDGREFDSSEKNGGQPFTFGLGQGQVIPGWDEGIALLNKGAKATLLIPSTMAYGEQARGENLPANSILRFDVELVDVK